MGARQANIIAALQKDILLMQGFKPALSTAADNGGLSLIGHAFPNHSFSLSVIHEFITGSPEDLSASYGFVAAIVSSLARAGGISAWITSKPVCPHALKAFGITPDKVLFIQPKEKDTLFVIEEALKCDGLAAVIADIKHVGFTESRRFQLAAEQSGVTGFMIRQSSVINANCSVTRWKVKQFHEDNSGLPGLGFPRWSVELLKVRNGKPGKWQMEWKAGKFNLIEQQVISIETHLRKVV